jgi:hypothetical protein
VRPVLHVLDGLVSNFLAPWRLTIKPPGFTKRNRIDVADRMSEMIDDLPSAFLGTQFLDITSCELLRLLLCGQAGADALAPAFDHHPEVIGPGLAAIGK